MGEPMRERLRRREKAADRGGNTSREQVMTDNRHGLNVICLMTGVLPALPAQRRDRRRIRAFARLTAGQCPLPGEGRRAGRLSDGSWYLNKTLHCPNVKITKSTNWVYSASS